MKRKMKIFDENGEKILLSHLLEDRERRKLHQNYLVEGFSKPLVCLTLNIPGEVKRSPLIDTAFDLAFDKVLEEIDSELLLHKEKIYRKTGCEGYFVINQEPKSIKNLVTAIEEQKSWGRILDIDVICSGQKLSRKDIGASERKCLLCENSAYACARSRNHSLEQVVEETNKRLKALIIEEISRKLGKLCVKSLLDEVYTTPKPGLVDKNNCGAHSDMDVGLFEKSAQSLENYFVEIATAGLMAERVEIALDGLRHIGIQAENNMFKATNGVNTHKGGIFSMGIICFCVGFLMSNTGKCSANDLHMACKKACANILADFEKIKDKKALTEGEALHKKRGILGIRGQAYEGFPAVFSGLKTYQDFKNMGLNENDSGVLTLITLIEHIDDTNCIKRGGFEGLEWVRGCAKEILNKDMPFNDKIQAIYRLDRLCIEKNISLGGCADMLSAIYFVDRVIGGFYGEN